MHRDKRCHPDPQTKRRNQTILIASYQSTTTLIPTHQSSIQVTHTRGLNYFFYQRTETKVQTQLWEFIKSKLHPKRFVIPRNLAPLFLSNIFHYYFSKFCLCYQSHASRAPTLKACTSVPNYFMYEQYTYVLLKNLNNKIKGAHDIAST